MMSDEMSLPEWAFQVENFDPPPDDELICSICQGVFCNPVRSPCLHVFCLSCISKWLSKNNSCPICREDVNILQEVVPILKNMIMKLTLSCHNSCKGCEAKFKLEKCCSHLKECLYELAQCRNWPCSSMVPRKEIVDHELNSCLYRYVWCLTCKIMSQNQVHEYIESLPAGLRDFYLLQRAKRLTLETSETLEDSFEENRWKVIENCRIDYFLCKKINKRVRSIKELDGKDKFSTFQSMSFEESRWKFTKDFMEDVEGYREIDQSVEVKWPDPPLIDAKDCDSSLQRRFKLLPSRLQHVQIPSYTSFTGMATSNFSIFRISEPSQLSTPLTHVIWSVADQQSDTMDTRPD